MRASEVRSIIVHCAATKPSMDCGFDEINQWHLDRGWSGCGYHVIIRRNGAIEFGRDFAMDSREFSQGAHVRGHNDNSIGVCLIGGMAQDSSDPELNYTDEQWDALRDVLTRLKTTTMPGARIHGHYEFDSHKTCPNFDAGHWYDTDEVVPTF